VSVARGERRSVDACPPATPPAPPGGEQPGGTQPPVVPSDQSQQDALGLSLGLSGHTRRLGPALRRGIGVRVACATVCDVRVRLVLTRKAARRVGLQRIIAATRANDVTAAQTVRLRFSRRTARRLRRARGRLKATIVARAGGERKRSPLVLRPARR
jgi:hypothetical protein